MRRGGLMSGANPYGMLNAQVGNYYAGPSGAALGALVAGQAIGDAFRDLGGAAARRQERADTKVQQDRAYGLQEQQAQREQQMFGWKQQEADQARLEKNRGRVATYWAVNGGENTDPGGKQFMEKFGYNPYEYADNNTLSRMQDRADQRALQERMAQDRNDTMRAIAGMRQDAKRDGKEPKMGDINTTRTAFMRDSGNFIAQRDGFTRVLNGAQEDNAVGDLKVIFGYMKLLDPTSVVREGEFANAENAQGVPDRIRNAYNKVIYGERLTGDQRSKFVDSSLNEYNTAKGNHGRIASTYGSLADAYGTRRDLVMPDLYGEADAALSAYQEKANRQKLSTAHQPSMWSSRSSVGSPAQQAQQPTSTAPNMPELPPGARLVR